MALFSLFLLGKRLEVPDTSSCSALLETDMLCYLESGLWLWLGGSAGLPGYHAGFSCSLLCGRPPMSR